MAVRRRRCDLRRETRHGHLLEIVCKATLWVLLCTLVLFDYAVRVVFVGPKTPSDRSLTLVR